jgi:hypothetical protein
METVQFKTKIKDDSIRIPAKYRGKFKDGVRVILMADNTDLRQRRVESLFATAEKLAALDEPVLSDAELEAEIAAAREARPRKARK